MVMLKMERVKYNGRAPPGRLEEIMRQHPTRIMKMDRNGKLPLDDGEFRLARNALNHYRNERIASGGYTDAADTALVKLIKAKAPMWPFG